MRDDYERVVCGPRARGVYESNYLKANEPSGEGAFWLKYNLMAPRQAGLARSAELWAIVWSGAGARPVVVRQVLLEGEGLRTREDAIDIEAGPASLTPVRARGALESGGHRVSWDLAIAGNEPPIFHYPHAAMYRMPFPGKKLMTARPRIELDGTLEVDGVETAVRRWPGLRGHNWGAAHPHAYAYANASLWDGPGDWLFDGFSGQILVGGLVSPLLSAAVLRRAGAELRLNSLARLLNRTARAQFPSWSCTFEGGGATLEVRADLDPEDVAGLRYLSPDGRLSYCYNTKFAELELRLALRGREVERRRSRLAELEFLTPEPVPGVPLHGDESLPGLAER